MARILVVEDDDGIREMVALLLSEDGHEVVQAPSAEMGLYELGRTNPDVLLVDLLLEAMGGMEFIVQARRVSAAPLLVVSALGDSRQVVAALEAGADDYVTKPFDAEVLLARCRALLRRRTRVPENDGKVIVDSVRTLVLSESAGTVTLAGEDVGLTATEFRLLVELASESGRVVSRSALLDRVWDRDIYEDERLVDVHVRRLRIKIEADPSDPRLVITVRGLGYRLDLG